MPNVVASPLTPTGVTTSARLSRTCSTQSCSRACRRMAAPTAPARCGRRSLQSRQGRQNTRRLEVRRRSTPTSSKNDRPASLSAIFVEENKRLLGQPVGDRDGNAAGPVVIARTRVSERLSAAPEIALPGGAFLRQDHETFQHARDERRGQAKISRSEERRVGKECR